MADPADAPSPPAKSPPAPPAPPAPVPAPAPEPVVESFDLTIDEFCARKSQTDNRVELLTAFHREEVGAGTIKASEGEFETRYAAFAVRPVS